MNPTYAQSRLIAVYRLLRQGKTAKARAACRRILREMPENAAAIHLLGLIYKEDADFEYAERCMRLSIELDPAAAEYHANLGNLMRDAGRSDDAEKAYRDALALDPNSKPARLGLVRTLVDLGRLADAEAEATALTRLHARDPDSFSLLAMTLRERGRLDEAVVQYKKALAVAPGHAAAWHNLGSVWSRMELPERALEALERAQQMGISGYEMSFNLGRTYLALNRFEEAERAFAEAVRARPRDTDAQINLARVRFMRGDQDFARDIAAAAARFEDDARLAMLFAIMLHRGGLLEQSEQRLQVLLARHGRIPEAVSALAEVLHESGRIAEARATVLEAVEAKPGDSIIVENAIAITLASGEADLAMQYIAAQRRLDPLGQGWLAYEAIAARLLDPDRYRYLYDFDRLIRVYDLDAPDGWGSIGELNDALRNALEHRHRFPTHPLDQSLRNGSQTARSLLTDPDPAIQAILRAFAEPIEDYRRTLGDDPGHPVSARNAGPAHITGAWSVRLNRNGYHVNHFHPEGWISSAYYVSPPDEVNDTARMPGWIKFGEPRFPVPGANPERFVQPRAGRLVLFPSCMWHGTNAIAGDEPRTTIAFDASPRSPAASV